MELPSRKIVCSLELTLLAQFLKVSPAYLITRPLNQWPINAVSGLTFSNNPSLAITQLADFVGNNTVFGLFGMTPSALSQEGLGLCSIPRHAAYNT